MRLMLAYSISRPWASQVADPCNVPGSDRSLDISSNSAVHKIKAIFMQSAGNEHQYVPIDVYLYLSASGICPWWRVQPLIDLMLSSLH